MFRRDYIMIQIEEFGRFLAALMGLKRERKFEDVLENINGWYKEKLLVDPEEIKKVEVGNLLKLLTKEKGLENQQLKMVAELMYMEGLTYFDNGDKEMSEDALEKARILFDFLMSNDPVFSFDWHEKQARIKEALDELRN